jgi:hypothetical protein
VSGAAFFALLVFNFTVVVVVKIIVNVVLDTFTHFADFFD